MGELPLAEIELRIALLPPISRGAPISEEWPARGHAGLWLHADRLIELWKAEGAVALAEGFRLLELEAVAGVIYRVLAEREYRGDPRYWHFPPFPDLLPALQEAAWQEILAGKLVLEAIKGVTGRQHHPLAPALLPRLTPDWALSRLIRDGRDEYIEVRVRPPVAPVKRWRKPPVQEAVKIALREIVKATPTLSGEALENALCEHVGEGMTRARARSAIKRWAPQTVKPPGRPRKNKSPN